MKRFIFNFAFLWIILPFAISAQSIQPKTVRDYFNILPERYFMFESCRPETDKNCEKARKQYLERFLVVDDNANSYFQTSGDAAQNRLKMKLFKQPDNTYLIGMDVFGEDVEIQFFIDYKNGSWVDVSRKVIPRYSKSNFYKLPRIGKIIQVFSVKTEKRLYDLVWKNGRFIIKK